MAHPSLLGLPRERRDKIFPFLLVSEYPLRTRWYKSSQYLTKNLPTELLSVKKQLKAEATHVIVESHTIKLGPGLEFTRELQQLRRSLPYAPRLCIKIVGIGHSPQLAAFLVEHHGLKDLHLNFSISVFTDANLLKCREPYDLVPLGRLRLPGKVELVARIRTFSFESRTTPPLNRIMMRSAESLFREFLKKLEERMKGDTPPDDPTPLFEGQDMSRSIG